MSNDGTVIHVALRTERLDCDAIEQVIESPANGAQCVFRGVVRRDSDLNPVESLEYEAYSEMAAIQLQAMTKDANKKWPGARIAIEHRLGLVPLGEPSVIIAVGTPHRAEAFACCRFLIEGLKHRVPIWKKEIGAVGARWVEGSSTANQTE
ncbi:MAG: molybdenum cofactor biosynthesis protein MoaE [Chloroflexota bacterium]|nr:molybdenum cofactor biosynthesis protein MoaE [Chloroflexota bacterium]